MSEATVFYCWQSDIPETRTIIENALAHAIEDLNKENSLRSELRLDKALRGAAGAVRIDHDILDRIDKCEVFVGDVTLVTAPNSEGRQSPNPCVLIELGYALKRFGWQHMVLAFNTAFGVKADLPFDIDKNRLLLFSHESDCSADEKKATKKTLADDLKKAIRLILGLPTLKDEIRRFFDQTNPAILKLVRYGKVTVAVNIGVNRLSELEKLLAYNGLQEFVTIRQNHNTLRAYPKTPAVRKATIAN